MLEPFLSRLVNKQIILASGSPQRKEILQTIRLPFQVMPSLFEENLDPLSFPSLSLFVEETAKRKGVEVAERNKTLKLEIPDLVISVDTIVILEENIIGKPKNKEDAISILQSLSGKTHIVHSCLVLLLCDVCKERNFHMKIVHEDTTVKMSTLSEEIIQAYVETGEPLDKAGAYDIQGIGGSLIEWIEGDYFNVVGFPLNKFCKEINSFCTNNLL